MFAKWTEVNGIKCQGKTEARICEILFRLNLNPKRGVKIDTPFGGYIPDFDCGSFYVEIKAPNSWLQACGMAPLIENARNPKLARISDDALKKMEYTNVNHKPIIVVIDHTSSKKKYMSYRPKTGLIVIEGLPKSIEKDLVKVIINDENQPD